MNPNPNLPLCVFCHPTMTLSSAIDTDTGLPCCVTCNAKTDKTPQLPRFQWAAVREATRDACRLELA